MRRRGVGSKLSYANVVSTIALVLAVSGGATAIALSLPKNSVKSKQIAPGAVKTSDIADGAVTGPKVDVSKLAKVPAAVRADTAAKADSAVHADSAGSADTAAVATSLSGFEAGGLAKAKTVSSALFTSSLELTAPGYGTFRLVCELNGPSTFDDEVRFGTTKAIVITGGGFDVPSSTGCSGHLQAFIVS
jgi:hypothetical protein